MAVRVDGHSDMSTAEYRLRAFEQQWVGQLLEIQDADDGWWLDSAVEWVLSGGHFGPDRRPQPDPAANGASQALLSLFLLKEATEWIDVGRAEGYFDPDAEPRAIRLSLKNPAAGRTVLDMREPIVAWSHLKNSVPIGPRVPAGGPSFALALQLAIDDLSEARMEHLRLLCFAPEAEWQRELSRVRDLGALIAELPNAALSDDAVDGLRWALSGSDSDLPATELPSDWRSPQALHRSARGEQLLQVHDELRRALVPTAAGATAAPRAGGPVPAPIAPQWADLVFPRGAGGGGAPVGAPPAVTISIPRQRGPQDAEVFEEIDISRRRE